MTDLARKAAENLEAVRERAPLVHNITNYVVMNFTANALLAMGASPVMAHAPEEIDEMVAIASALALNIGTLTEAWVEAMVNAGRKAGEIGIPVVLDPVGAGATRFRTESAKRILSETPVRVVRGNPSEIMALGEGITGTRGVDSAHGSEEALEAALALAGRLKTTLAITGATDYVTDGERVISISNGHPLMGRITGSGCTASAVIAAFASVEEEPILAAASALAFYGVAGEVAAMASDKPGSFMVHFIDALYAVRPEEVAQSAKIRILQGGHAGPPAKVQLSHSKSPYVDTVR